MVSQKGRKCVFHIFGLFFAYLSAYFDGFITLVASYNNT